MPMHPVFSREQCVGRACLHAHLANAVWYLIRDGKEERGTGRIPPFAFLREGPPVAAE